MHPKLTATVCAVVLLSLVSPTWAQTDRDKFEQANKEALSYLTKILDDRILPRKTADAQNLSSRIKAQLAQLPALTSNLQRSAAVEKIWIACDSKAIIILERLTQAANRERAQLDTLASSATVVQRAEYWRVKLRWDSYFLLANHLIQFEKLMLIERESYDAAVIAQAVAPKDVANAFRDLALSISNMIETNCKEYEFVQDLYDSVGRR